MAKDLSNFIVSLRTGNVAQLVECLSNIHRLLSSTTTHHKSEQVIHLYNFRVMGDEEKKIRTSQPSLATE